MGEDNLDKFKISTDRMLEIATILDIENEPGQLIAFTVELNNTVVKWRSTICSSPVKFENATHGIAPSKRIRWLKNNVENAGNKLLECLEEGNDPYFSSWGSFYPNELVYDRGPVREELRRFLGYADSLIRDLYAQKNEGAPQTGEMRYEIVWELIQLFRKHFPELPAVRGKHDKDLGYWVGFLPEFVNSAFAEIEGKEPGVAAKVDNLIATALKD